MRSARQPRCARSGHSRSVCSWRTRCAATSGIVRTQRFRSIRRARRGTVRIPDTGRRRSPTVPATRRRGKPANCGARVPSRNVGCTLKPALEFDMVASSPNRCRGALQLQRVRHAIRGARRTRVRGRLRRRTPVRRRWVAASKGRALAPLFGDPTPTEATHENSCSFPDHATAACAASIGS
jgi:hypothetical protein